MRSAVRTRGAGAEADEPEQLPRAVRVGVLVENALAGAGADRLRLRRVVEQAPGTRRAPRPRPSTTSSSFPGSNQRSIPAYGLETIAAPALASSNGRHEEEAGTLAAIGA